MKIKQPVTVIQEFDVKYFCAKVHPRYFEDSTLNGVEDISYDEQQEGAKPRMPMFVEDPKSKHPEDKYVWELKIDLETGNILWWPEGYEARIHYKICDDGIYWLETEHGGSVHVIESYVPHILNPGDRYDSDYAIFNIDKKGHIVEYDNVDVEDLVKEFLMDEGF